MRPVSSILENFEFIAMENLGPSVVDQQKKNDSGTGLRLETVIRINSQLAGLEYIHSHGIMHHDTKPEYFLRGLDNSTTKVIDFGIFKPISYGLPKKYDPLKVLKTLVGPSCWVSEFSQWNSNADIHSCAIDLAPRDDLASLTYVALFFLRGYLAWKPRPRLESQLHSQEIIRLMKSSCSGKELSSGFHVEFGDMLDYFARFDQLPEYWSLGAYSRH
ncbi:kinase-like domain-containing protein [Armillaria fumosa]|nr:kinase-like domain-containing protein [Armillaria fumosa]